MITKISPRKIIEISLSTKKNLRKIWPNFHLQKQIHTKINHAKANLRQKIIFFRYYAEIKSKLKESPPQMDIEERVKLRKQANIPYLISSSK